MDVCDVLLRRSFVQNENCSDPPWFSQPPLTDRPHGFTAGFSLVLPLVLWVPTLGKNVYRGGKRLFVACVT